MVKEIKKESKKTKEILLEEDEDEGVINKGVFDIFNDKDDDVFQFEILANKKKLQNQTRSSLADILKVKMKALDMMTLILTNNKNILKTDELKIIDELSLLMKNAKQEKELFEPMMKRYISILYLYNIYIHIYYLISYLST